MDGSLTELCRELVLTPVTQESMNSFSNAICFGNLDSPLALKTCQACLRQFDELKVLFCQHSICKLCVDQLKIENHGYKCPVCGKECPVPNGGFQHLPDSLLAHKFTQLQRRRGSAHVSLKDLDLSELKNKLEEEISAGERWIVAAFRMINQQKARLVMVLNVQGKSRKFLEEYICETVDLCEDKLSKLAKGLEKEKAELEDRVQGFKAYIELRKSVSERVQKLKDEKCSSEDFKLAETLLADLTGAYTQTQELHSHLDDGKELKVGDSVRLKYEVPHSLEDFIRGDVTHSSVGVLVENHQTNGKVSVIFPEKHNWKGNSCVLERSLKKSEIPYVGDEVRVKVKEPHFGWQNLQEPNSSGKLTRIATTESALEGDLVIYIDFPDVKEWKGLYRELFEPKPAEMEPSLLEMLTSIFVQSFPIFPGFPGLSGLPGLPVLHRLPSRQAHPIPCIEQKKDVVAGLTVRQAIKEREKTSLELKPTQQAQRDLRSRLQQKADSGSTWCKESAATLLKFRKCLESWEKMEQLLRVAIRSYQRSVEKRCSKKVEDEEREKMLKEKTILEYIRCLNGHLETIIHVLQIAKTSLFTVFSFGDISPLQLLLAQKSLYVLKFKNESVRRINYGVDSFWEPNGGDCVMLRPEAFTKNFMSEYLRGENTMGSVGLLMRSYIREPEAEVLFPGDKATRMVKSAFVVEILTERRMPFKGDKVKLKRKAITLQPQASNFQAPTSANGILKEMFPRAMVKFPGQEELWCGPYEDIELVPGCGFEPGDNVWVRRTIPEPSRGWGGVTKSSVGVVRLVIGRRGNEEITVDFPECKGWIGLATDLQRVRDIWLANEVQIKLTVSEPRKGWQSVGRNDVGYVLTIQGDECVVGFPTNPRFKCYVDEIEPCRYEKGPYDKPATETEEGVIYVTPEEMRLLYLKNFS
ncbi:uncharacterized protein [Watersipora subatra]|uniref:uncharacterized protein n=1 Tax=Watersipora subatra TaxID=2589382 RepID=UPI00355B7489